MEQRQNKIKMKALEAGGGGDSDSLASSSNTTNRNGAPKPFKPHNHIMLQHDEMESSIDNMVTESNSLYARRVKQQQQLQQQQQPMRYTSLLSLNIKDGNGSNSNSSNNTTQKRSNSASKTKAEVEVHQHQSPSNSASSSAVKKKKRAPAAPSASKKGPAQKQVSESLPPQKEHNNQSMNKPKLKQLGRMSPEEQVGRFLQSVEESGSSNNNSNNSSSSSNKGMFSKNQKAPLIGVNNRNNSNGNKWKSMDNLNVNSSNNNNNNNHKRRLPPFNKPVSNKTNNNNVPPKVAANSRPKPPRGSASAKVNSFREGARPKSNFAASMSQLDKINDVNEEQESINRNNRRSEPRTVGKASENKMNRRSMEVQQQQNHKRMSASVADLRDHTTNAESFSVRTNVVYLGRVSMADGASSLSALQLPLKDLYFRYMQLTMSGRRPHLGSLEITASGLRTSYVGEGQLGIQEVFNPFPSIAVWAAVRFSYRREAANGGDGGRSRFMFAFLPLVSEPGDAEKDQVSYTFCNLHKQ